MSALLKKYKEIIMYVVFGALTTLVNFVVFWILERLLGEDLYMLSNFIAWFISVVFAYITNKLFVFESKSWKFNIFIKEILEFFGARVFSFAIEEGGLWLFVEIFGFDRFSFSISSITITGKIISKVVLAVIVVILNYFFSKYVIFRKKKKSNSENN